MGTEEGRLYPSLRSLPPTLIAPRVVSQSDRQSISGLGSRSGVGKGGKKRKRGKDGTRPRRRGARWLRLRPSPRRHWSMEFSEPCDTAVEGRLGRLASRLPLWVSVLLSHNVVAGPRESLQWRGTHVRRDRNRCEVQQSA